MDALKELQARLERNTKEPAKPPKPGTDIRRADIPPSGGAWLVETPRKEFFGKGAHGVEIRNGFGLVEADEPNGPFIVHRLEHDFGYRITALDARLAEKFRLEFSRQQRPKVSGVQGMLKPGEL